MTEASSSRHAWRLLIFLTFLNVLNFVDRQLIASLAPMLMRDLGLSRAEIGLLFGAPLRAGFDARPDRGSHAERGSHAHGGLIDHLLTGQSNYWQSGPPVRQLATIAVVRPDSLHLIRVVSYSPRGRSINREDQYNYNDSPAYFVRASRRG
jgi:hypothetical protein